MGERGEEMDHQDSSGSIGRPLDFQFQVDEDEKMEQGFSQEGNPVTEMETSQELKNQDQNDGLSQEEMCMSQGHDVTDGRNEETPATPTRTMEVDENDKGADATLCTASSDVEALDVDSTNEENDEAEHSRKEQSDKKGSTLTDDKGQPLTQGLVYLAAEGETAPQSDSDDSPKQYRLKTKEERDEETRSRLRIARPSTSRNSRRRSRKSAGATSFILMESVEVKSEVEVVDEGMIGNQGYSSSDDDGRTIPADLADFIAVDDELTPPSPSMYRREANKRVQEESENFEKELIEKYGTPYPGKKKKKSRHGTGSHGTVASDSKQGQKDSSNSKIVDPERRENPLPIHSATATSSSSSMDAIRELSTSMMSRLILPDEGVNMGNVGRQVPANIASTATSTQTGINNATRTITTQTHWMEFGGICLTCGSDRVKIENVRKLKDGPLTTMVKAKAKVSECVVERNDPPPKAPPVSQDLDPIETRQVNRNLKDELDKAFASTSRKPANKAKASDESDSDDADFKNPPKRLRSSGSKSPPRKRFIFKNPNRTRSAIGEAGTTSATPETSVQPVAGTSNSSPSRQSGIRVAGLRSTRRTLTLSRTSKSRRDKKNENDEKLHGENKEKEKDVEKKKTRWEDESSDEDE